mmetsp:Transcript_25060/g.41283  ORF Transcript_25060/g.41283 Transcript_25060/m.41283 type:complete len:420 (-) Transcript_25060:312-1571(-)
MSTIPFLAGRFLCPLLRIPILPKIRLTQRRSVFVGPLTHLSEQEQLVQESVRSFAKDEVLPLVQSMDAKAAIDQTLLGKLFSQGLMGIEIPSNYHGSSMTFFDTLIVVEQIAIVDPSVAVIVDIQNTLVNTVIQKWGTPTQQAEYLPRLAQNTVGSFCISESESGSDAFALRTTATKDGDHWVLNGSKSWISNSKEAGLFLVFANANPASGYRGITCFIVERSNPGIRIGRAEDKLGIRASSTCTVHFDDCRVPETAVVGEVGKGYKIAIESLNEGRIGIAAQMVGLAQGTFDATLPYIMQRKQFGQPIAEFQGVQFQFAQLRTDIEAARLMVYNAARLKMAEKEFVLEAAMAKLFASQVAERVASQCVELLGGVGFTKDFPAEKFFRDSKIGSIYEGTSNIQLNTIAKLVLRHYKSHA